MIRDNQTELDSLERQAVARDEYVIVHRETQKLYNQTQDDEDTNERIQMFEDYEMYEAMSLAYKHRIERILEEILLQ